MMSRCCKGSPVPLIIRFLDSTGKLVDRVLEIRDDPPEGLGRTPGPKAILYYLRRDEALKEGGLRRPQSTRTIHRMYHLNFSGKEKPIIWLKMFCSDREG